MNDAQRQATQRPVASPRQSRKWLIGPLVFFVLFAGVVFFAGELLAAARYASIGGLSFVDGIGLWNQPLRPDTSYQWWEVGVKLRIDRAVSGFIVFTIIGFAVWLGSRLTRRPGQPDPL